MVYVISVDGKPLMPCTPAKARHLLQEGKAVRRRTFSKEVFAIQLTFVVDGNVSDITLGIDAGYKTIGLSASSREKEYYSAEVSCRDDITSNLTARREARRTRRNRKTRYRSPRFDNRRRKDGWLAPSAEARIALHERAVKDVCSILPISKIIIETAQFDIQKIKNPEIEGEGYQKGEQLGFWNVREYVLFRDGHTCQACKGKSKDKVLEVHHIRSRSNGGTDRPDNLITLCASCHHKHHAEENLKIPFPSKEFTAEAFMGIARWETYNRLKNTYGDIVSFIYGYVTKNTRVSHGLEKAHRTDALCIAGHPQAQRLDSWLFIKKVRCHNRQLHKANTLKCGVRKKNQSPRLVHGFRLFDKVSHNGQTCFITGRCSSGYFALKTIEGAKVHDSASYKNIRLLEESGTILTERRMAILPSGQA